MPRVLETAPSVQRPDVATLEQPVRDALTHADEQRAAGLRLLADVRTARNLVLAKQRVKLAATLGATAPAVRALDDKVAANRAAEARLTINASRAATPTPTVAGDEWVLYGSLHRSDGTAAGGLTVALYASGRRVEGLPCDVSDGEGRYLLRVPLQLFERYDVKPLAATKETSHAAAETALVVRILDGSGACLYDAPDRFVPQGGVADALDVTLPAAGGSTPPPAATTTPPSAPPPRTPATTQPKAKRKSKRHGAKPREGGGSKK